MIRPFNYARLDDDLYAVQTTCPHCGKVNTITVSKDQLDRLQDGGECIQNILPGHTATEREYLLSGFCQEYQEVLFAPPTDDEDEYEEEVAV